MRIALAAAALAALAFGAGCATAPIAAAPAEAVTPPPIESGPPRSGYGAVIARAGRADAPQLGEVVRTLGAADIDSREGAGAMLTYRTDVCALVLLFASGALAEAHSMPRHAGETPAGLDDCVEAVYARNQR